MPFPTTKVPFNPRVPLAGLQSARGDSEGDQEMEPQEDPLAVLQNGPGNAQAGLQLAGLQESRLDEMRHNFEKNGPLGSGATRGDIASLEQDVNQNPLGSPAVALRQREDIGRQRQAEFAGFQNPQQQGQYQAMLEGAKVNMPLTVEQEKGRQQRQTAQQFGQIAQMLNGRPSATQSPAQGGAVQPAAQPPSTPAPPPPRVPGRVYVNDQDGSPMAASPGQQADPLQFNPQPHYRLGLSGSGNPSLTQEPTPRMSLQERQTVEDLKTAYRQMDEVRNMIRQNMTQETQQKIANPPGFMGQLLDVAKAGGQRAMYGAGFQDPTLSGDQHKAELYNKLTQLTELSKVMASKGMLKGMRNYQWIKEIQDHLARGGQPTPTMLERLDNIMGEYPQMIKDIYDTASNQPVVFPQQEQ